MESLIKFDDVKDKIISVRNQNVILDCDVATLYEVQTMRINEAVKNNPDKFPKGYVFELNNQEFRDLLSKISIANISSKTRFLPKVFTEKGLYMLATILKSPRATQTTIAIVEAFAKLRALSNNIATINSIEDIETIEPEVLESTGGLLNELLFSGVPPSSTETSVELNLGVMKIKRKITNDNINTTHSVVTALQNEINELKKMISELKNN